MRKILTVALAILLAAAIPAQAQVAGMTREQFREYKENFLKNELNLDDAVAARFFPQSEDYQNKKQKLYNENQSLMDKAGMASEAEYRAIIDRLQAIGKATNDLEETYLAKLKTVLTYEQIFKLGKAETKFQKHILKELTRSKNRTRK